VWHDSCARGDDRVDQERGDPNARGPPGPGPRRARLVSSCGASTGAQPSAGIGRGETARRQTFRTYVEDYGAWAAVHKRGWEKTERYTAARLVTVLGDQVLQDIQTAHIECMLESLLEGRSGATRNRYRDLCSACSSARSGSGSSR
jgi:hypothetical protein